MMALRGAWLLGFAVRIWTDLPDAGNAHSWYQDAGWVL
jgi:hypothetical protein